MRGRSIVALILTPLIGGAIPTITYLLDSSLDRIGPRELVQIGAWVGITLAFEVFVLLPIAHWFRIRKDLRMRVFAIGSITWSLFAYAWLIVVFGMPPNEALISAWPLGLAGLAITASFVLLWGKARNTMAR